MTSGPNRRDVLSWSASALVTSCVVPPLVLGDERVKTEAKTSTGMGLVVYCRNIRRRWLNQNEAKSDLFAPLAFLKHCHKSGTGGMQIKLGALTPKQVAELREYADEHRLFIDAVVSPPKDDGDIARFESEIRVAADIKAQAARTVIMPGRRYERFSTLNEFREFEKRGQTMLQRAAPVVEKHRVRLAVENHKDQRLDERVALFRHLDSEFIGACVDTGNSFALLDDPYETIEQLAPFAFTVHLKDQALRAYPDGFLLGDIALGDGSFDLKRMVTALKRVKPDIRFALELITRDALKVPCLRNSYWSTMPEVPANELAAALEFVRDNSVENIASVSSSPLEKQVAMEDENVQRSILYARDELGL